MSKAGNDVETIFPIEVLKPDPDNPRSIGEAALRGLGVSLETFGPLDIVFNETTGELVSGHQRVRALRAAGATTVTRVGTDGHIKHPKTNERFPVRFVAWDETKQRMANLVANNHELQGEFTALAVEQLKALEQEAGFEELELGKLERSLLNELAIDEQEPAPGETDPDESCDPPDEPISKLGDLWLLGSHRLLCGDSTSAKDVEHLMGGEKAVMMATDPPYGVSVVGGSKDPRAKTFRSGGKIENDALQGERLESFLRLAFGLAAENLSAGAAFYIWYADVKTKAFHAAADELGGMKNVLVWVKPRFVFGRCDYHYRHEPCIYGWTPGAGHQWFGDRNQSSVFEFGRDEGPDGREKKKHPTVKPVALFGIPMRNHTRPGDVCYEPFCGSGSQIIAAEQLSRRCFAMELDPRYVDVAVARWEKFTGEKAVKANG